MRITTTYFGPAELKNLYYDQPQPTAYVPHCLSARQTVALVATAQIAIDLYIFNYGLLWTLTTGTCTRADIQQCKLQFMISRHSPKLQLS